MTSKGRSQLFSLDKLASITIPGKTITILLTEYHNVTDEMGLSNVDLKDMVCLTKQYCVFG